MDLRQKAERLAARPYTMLVVNDETTEGEPIWVALSVELVGCVGQGSTAEEAAEDLRAAQVDFIESILEDGLPVPEPQTQPTISRTTSSSIGYIFNSDRPLDERGPVFGRLEDNRTIRLTVDAWAG